VVVVLPLATNSTFASGFVARKIVPDVVVGGSVRHFAAMMRNGILRHCLLLRDVCTDGGEFRRRAELNHALRDQARATGAGTVYNIGTARRSCVGRGRSVVGIAGASIVICIIAPSVVPIPRRIATRLRPKAHKMSARANFPSVRVMF
jgi:hypothetical protein